MMTICGERRLHYGIEYKNSVMHSGQGQYLILIQSAYAW